jgi:hypothetical protein
MGKDWSKEETDFAIADYLAMPSAEAEHRPSRKSSHYRFLRARLDVHTGDEVEINRTGIGVLQGRLITPNVNEHMSLRDLQRFLAQGTRSRLCEGTEIRSDIILADLQFLFHQQPMLSKFSEKKSSTISASKAQEHQDRKQSVSHEEDSGIATADEGADLPLAEMGISPKPMSLQDYLIHLRANERSGWVLAPIGRRQLQDLAKALLNADIRAPDERLLAIGSRLRMKQLAEHLANDSFVLLLERDGTGSSLRRLSECSTAFVSTRALFGNLLDIVNSSEFDLLILIGAEWILPSLNESIASRLLASSRRWLAWSEDETFIKNPISGSFSLLENPALLAYQNMWMSSYLCGPRFILDDEVPANQDAVHQQGEFDQKQGNRCRSTLKEEAARIVLASSAPIHYREVAERLISSGWPQKDYCNFQQSVYGALRWLSDHCSSADTGICFLGEGRWESVGAYRSGNTGNKVSEANDIHPIEVQTSKELNKRVPDGQIGVQQEGIDGCSGILTDIYASLQELSPTDDFVVRAALGFNGSLPSTYAAIGVKLGVTRERIRQRASRALSHIARHRSGWPERLNRELERLLDGRRTPLHFDLLIEESPWFSEYPFGSESLSEVLRAFGDGKYAIVHHQIGPVVTTIDDEGYAHLLGSIEEMLQGKHFLGCTREEIELLASACVEGSGCIDLVPLVLSDLMPFLQFMSSKKSGSGSFAGHGNAIGNLVMAILAESPMPLHYEDIATTVSAQTGKAMNEGLSSSVKATCQRSGALLFGRGIYGLERHLETSESDVSNILDALAEVMHSRGESRQWHIDELHKALTDHSDGKLVGLNVPSKYVLQILMQRSRRFRYLGYFVWAVAESQSTSPRLEVQPLVEKELSMAGSPLARSELLERLRLSRGLNQHQILVPCSAYSIVGPGIWGLVDRDFILTKENRLMLLDHVARVLTESCGEINFENLDSILARDRGDIPVEFTFQMLLGLLRTDERFVVKRRAVALVRQP